MIGSRHRLRSAVASTVIAVVVVLAPSALARAHAIVDEVTPADGSALVDQPHQVVFTFSEPILADGVGVEIASGVDSATPTVSAAVDTADPTRVIVDLGAMPNGTFQVRVRVHDREDLHEVVARTSFAVGESAPDPSPPIVDDAEPMETAARWMFATGLVLLVGVVATRFGRRAVVMARPRRLAHLVVSGVVLVIAGRVGILVARTVSLGGTLSDDALTVVRTSDAQRLVLVAVALGCVVVSELPTRLVWLDVLVRLDHRLTVRQALGWTGVVNLAVLAGWGGHSALEGPLEPLSALAKSAHLVGIGLWVGVLAVAVVVNVGTPQLRPSLSASSSIAVTGAFLTVASGLLLSSRLVISFTALAATPYGRMLALKLVLVVIAVPIGLLLSRTARTAWPVVELGVVSLVVVLGAAIATATPALDPGFTDRDGAPATVAPALAIEDLLVQARAIPGRPGINTIELRIGETRRPSPGPVVDIDLEIDGNRYVAQPNADGVAYAEGVTLAVGDSPVVVVLHRRRADDASADLVVSTRPAVYEHEVFISSARLGGWLVGLAVIVSLVGVAIWLRAEGRLRVDRQSEVRHSGPRPDIERLMVAEQVGNESRREVLVE